MAVLRSLTGTHNACARNGDARDVAAVRENWPVAAYLRETAPLYRVVGLPVTHQGTG